MRKMVLYILIVGLLALISGCGASGPNNESVSGPVPTTPGEEAEPYSGEGEENSGDKDEGPAISKDAPKGYLYTTPTAIQFLLFREVEPGTLSGQLQGVRLTTDYSASVKTETGSLSGTLSGSDITLNIGSENYTGTLKAEAGIESATEEAGVNNTAEERETIRAGLEHGLQDGPATNPKDWFTNRDSGPLVGLVQDVRDRFQSAKANAGSYCVAFDTQMELLDQAVDYVRSHRADVDARIDTLNKGVNNLKAKRDALGNQASRSMAMDTEDLAMRVQQHIELLNQRYNKALEIANTTEKEANKLECKGE